MVQPVAIVEAADGIRSDGGAVIPMQLDPTCLFHGKKLSQHHCLYCAICFRNDLTPETCYVDKDGGKWDMCKQCGEREDEMRAKA